MRRRCGRHHGQVRRMGNNNVIGGRVQQGVAADEARILVGRRPMSPCLHFKRASQLNAGVRRALEPFAVLEGER